MEKEIINITIKFSTTIRSLYEFFTCIKIALKLQN